jgi:hypothetical protein
VQRPNKSFHAEINGHSLLPKCRVSLRSYKAYSLSVISTPQLSLYVAVDARFLCDKATVFWLAIKETPSRFSHVSVFAATNITTAGTAEVATHKTIGKCMRTVNEKPSHYLTYHVFG